jgi:hypothetical protein
MPKIIQIKGFHEAVNLKGRHYRAPFITLEAGYSVWHHRIKGSVFDLRTLLGRGLRRSFWPQIAFSQRKYPGCGGIKAQAAAEGLKPASVMCFGTDRGRGTDGPSMMSISGYARGEDAP